MGAGLGLGAAALTTGDLGSELLFAGEEKQNSHQTARDTGYIHAIVSCGLEGMY